MVDAAAPRPLTKLSFRRDVRLFFAILVGFLAVLILLLLLLLQSFLGHTYDGVWENWRTVADIAARELADPGAGADPSLLSARLTLLQARYGIAGVKLVRRDGTVVTAGVSPEQTGVEHVVKRIPDGTLTLVFDASRLEVIRRTFWITATICLAAVGIGMLLLTLFIPRITKPIEAMLESAAAIGERPTNVDEQQYLIDTFRRSIAMLRDQEAELHRLHDLQKTRADDLARVTAALTRSLTSGFLAVDPQGRVVDVNAAAREILRPSPADVSGLPLHDAFGDNGFTTAVEGAVRDRLSLARVEIALDIDRVRHVIGLTTVPLVDEEQQFLGVLALFTDLTPFRHLETRVREMQNLADLGEISAGIAHEFRNSIATILGYLRLSRRASLTPDALKAVEKAEQEAALLSAAVDGLLAFARPMKLERRPVDLYDLLQEIVERAATQATDVTVECRGTATIVDGDSVLLTRLFDNLVRNAVESVQQSGKPGSVTIDVLAAPHPVVRIDDEGVGIADADVPRLFLPFQSDKPGGYGLGLPLAKKIALLHGATLSLRGKGGGGAIAAVEFAPDVSLDDTLDTKSNSQTMFASEPIHGVRV